MNVVPQCDSCVCGRQERLDSQDVVGYIVKAINMNRLRSETVCMDLLMCCSRNLMRDRLEGAVWCGFGEVSWCLIRCFQLYVAFRYTPRLDVLASIMCKSGSGETALGVARYEMVPS